MFEDMKSQLFNILYIIVQNCFLVKYILYAQVILLVVIQYIGISVVDGYQPPFVLMFKLYIYIYIYSDIVMLYEFDIN
jgi:hypothetical protein